MIVRKNWPSWAETPEGRGSGALLTEVGGGVGCLLGLFAQSRRREPLVQLGERRIGRRCREGWWGWFLWGRFLESREGARDDIPHGWDGGREMGTFRLLRQSLLCLGSAADCEEEEEKEEEPVGMRC